MHHLIRINIHQVDNRPIAINTKPHTTNRTLLIERNANRTAK